jgi:hypothetical protein
MARRRFRRASGREANRVSLQKPLKTARISPWRGFSKGRSGARRACSARGRSRDGGVDFGRSEGVAGGDVREAHQRMHQGELPRVIELEARDALSGRGDCWFSKFLQLAAINKGLQDVLLDVEIVVVDGRPGLAEGGKVVHRFVDAVIVDVVACRFCAQDQVIADILPDKPFA